MDRLTANLFSWSSELWSVCWHFLLAALDNLWTMYMGLLRTWHFLALPVYKAEPHVSARGTFSPTKPASAAPSPIALSITDPNNAWISWEVGYRCIGRASEVWAAEKPHGGSHLMVRNLLWVVCCLGRIDGFLLLFRNYFVWKSSGTGGRICLCLKFFQVMLVYDVEMIPRCLDWNHQPRWQYAQFVTT